MKEETDGIVPARTGWVWRRAVGGACGQALEITFSTTIHTGFLTIV